MSEVKSCKKKLSDAGAAACVLSFISLLFAVAGSLLEFIAREIYRSEFGNTDMVFAKEWDTYIASYQNSLIMLVFSLMVFIVCLSCRRKKKIGAEFGAMVTLGTAVVSLYPAAAIYHVFADEMYQGIDSFNTDVSKFYTTIHILSIALPLISGAFLFIGGIALWGRTLTDDFSVRCPIMKRQPIEDVSEDIAVVRAPQPAQTAPSFEFTNSNYIPPEKEQTAAQAEPQPDTAAPNAVIPETARCASCGAVLKPNAKFCQSCGFAVEK